MKEGSYLNIHNNLIVNGEIRLIQANQDNHVVSEKNAILRAPSLDGATELANERSKGGIPFGLTEEFPSWLRDNAVPVGKIAF